MSASVKDNILPPEKESLEKINKAYGFDCSDDELNVFSDEIKNYLEAYEYVNNFELPPFKSKHGEKRDYRKPSAEENSYNAWYVKCNIEGEKGGKLSGKKVAFKDNTAVADIPMMNGSAIMEGYVPEYDATVVQRILSHGGTVVGKTTCEDMCFSGASYVTKYGPVRNSKNRDHSAGGSSSGSGVVVALGEADMAIGGDQGGSIRIPASNCGIVGLKPTHGLVPYTGAVPIFPCIDHLGPMTRTVADCALMLECIAGYDDENDYRQERNITVYEYSKLIYPHKTPKEKIKIGVLKEGIEHCDGNVKDVFLKAVEVLKPHDMLEIAEMSYPQHKDASKVYLPILVGGFYGSMINGYVNGYGTKGFHSHTMAKQVRDGLKSKANESSANIKFMTIMSAYIHETNGNNLVSKAKTIATHMTRQYDDLLDKFDVIVMPTLNKTPCKIPSDDAPLREKIDSSLDMILNTSIFDITGHPALSLNCGYSEGLPVGFQIVGKHYDEVTVLNSASIIEEALAKLQ